MQTSYRFIGGNWDSLNIPAIFFFVAGLPLWLLGIRAFDHLVLLECTRHADAWKADGEPHPYLFEGGYKWRRSLGTDPASRRRYLVWLFRTPEWSLSDPEAARYLHRWRLLAGLWDLVFTPVFLGTIFFTLWTG
jgi:hypothetical protein